MMCYNNELSSLEMGIVSFNCRGFNASKSPFIKDLFNNYNATFLLLQEHWLSDQQIPQLANIDDGLACVGISGFGSEEILSGRPYGGCAILWRINAAIKVNFLTIDSDRICAVHVISDCFKLLIVCVYMPYEGDGLSSDEFQFQLSLIENLLADHNDSYLVVAGDFNVDFSRMRPHTALLNSFCERSGLHPADNHRSNSVDFTYHFGLQRFSCLDHFLLSPVLFDECVDGIFAVHSVDNMSDHEPVVLQLSLKIEVSQNREIAHVPRISWRKASPDQVVNYKNVLSSNLKSIYLPVKTLLCNDIHCSNPVHFDEINRYSISIYDACISAARETIPITCSRGSRGRIPGWTERVKPSRERSLFWHNIWVNCGRPRDGYVAAAMRRTRAAYHLQIRLVRKNEDAVVKEKVADSVIHDRGRNFWSEIKKIRGTKARSPGAVDGLSDTPSIAALFADKYRDLYTSVPYDEVDMQRIMDVVNSKLPCTNVTSDYMFYATEVREAIGHMKRGKNDGSNELVSDHLINANDDLIIHIACLFSTFSVHGAVPTNFHSSVILPIPKSRNASAADSNNYRGIALSSLLGKILDYIILDRYRDTLSSCEYQFGFKRNSSTNLCTMVLKETLNYYYDNSTNVFCCFLDATKAFDRVNYCKLFRLLLTRNLPPHIIRLLINIYVNNNVCVSWCNVKSDTFRALNGVKQGAVLSPILYCVYVDNLLQLLEKEGVGCHIGFQFLGALAYADDLVLIAPAASAMRTMLSICDNFARDFDVIFNASKSKWLAIIPANRSFMSNMINNCMFGVGGNSIDFVDKFVHLGHIISSNLTDTADVECRRSTFITEVNNMSCFFNKLDVFTRFRLFRSYCTSYYGSELWKLNCSSIDSFCTSWRRALRIVWRLPFRAHSFLLPLISNVPPFRDDICRRSINFIRSCMFHNSYLVRFISYNCIMFGSKSSFLRHNAYYCARRFGCGLDSILYGNVCVLTETFSNEMFMDAGMLLELLLLREGVLSCGLNSEEISTLIIYLCTKD